MSISGELIRSVLYAGRQLEQPLIENLVVTNSIVLIKLCHYKPYSFKKARHYMNAAGLKQHRPPTSRTFSSGSGNPVSPSGNPLS